MGCECEYGFGPIVPCSILFGGKKIAEIVYRDSHDYRLISSELGIARDLIKGYEQLGAYDEAVEIVTEQIKAQDIRVKDVHVEGVDYLIGTLADFTLKSDENGKVVEWVKSLVSEGFKYNEYAEEFLNRFGGLKFTGTGKDARSRVEVCFDPECYASGEYDRMEELEKIAFEFNSVVKRKGMGLMQGLELRVPVGDIVNEALENGLVVISAGGNVLRMLPPLIISKENIDLMLDILRKIL